MGGGCERERGRVWSGERESEGGIEEEEGEGS